MSPDAVSRYRYTLGSCGCCRRTRARSYLHAVHIIYAYIIIYCHLHHSRVQHVIHFIVAGGQWLWESSGQETRYTTFVVYYLYKKFKKRTTSRVRGAGGALGENRRRRGRLRPVAFATCSRQLAAASRQPSPWLAFFFYIITKIIIIFNLVKKHTQTQLTALIWLQRRVWRSPSSCTSSRSSPGSRRD